MYLISSFSPLKHHEVTTISTYNAISCSSHEQVCLIKLRFKRYFSHINIPKTNTRMFGSNLTKNKSIKDWNEIIRKIHFTSELRFKRVYQTC